MTMLNRKKKHSDLITLANLKRNLKQNIRELRKLNQRIILRG